MIHCVVLTNTTDINVHS